MATSTVASGGTGPPAKVLVRFHAIGDAPILRQPVYKISGHQRFGTVAQFLRKELGMGPAGSAASYSAGTSGSSTSAGAGGGAGGAPAQQLFLYVNQAFAPAPDESVANLHANFRAPEGHLIVNYCTSAAWG